MNLKLKTKDFRVTKGSDFKLKNHQTSLEKRLYDDKNHYKDILGDFRKELDELQNKMYAHDRFSLLLVFQAMDAAGKDGTIRHVMSGVNTHGVEVHSFKKPCDHEIDHDFLWRTNRALPPRGKIGIFNRSYYEEVLVCRVHPEIVHHSQRLPRERTDDLSELWKNRYQSILNLERHLVETGTHIMKFFLYLSKDEQKRRFLDRIDRPEKNWKFSSADIRERGYWDRYMEAYETAIQETSTKDAPWHVIPADDKRNMRLIVSHLITERLQELPMSYPELPKEQLEKLAGYREQLVNE